MFLQSGWIVRSFVDFLTLTSGAFSNTRFKRVRIPITNARNVASRINRQYGTTVFGAYAAKDAA